MRNINEIIIHCTATPSDRDVTVEEIRQWHISRGFDDIGYHYVIDRNGKIHIGRPVEVVGAHCHGHNRHSIGIAYVGGLHRNGTPCDTRTTSQIYAIVSLLCDLVYQFPSINKISGHNDYSNKACPCFDVSSLNYDLEFMKGGVQDAKNKKRI